MATRALPTAHPVSVTDGAPGPPVAWAVTPTPPAPRKTSADTPNRCALLDVPRVTVTVTVPDDPATAVAST
jgi:hypothetical protein